MGPYKWGKEHLTKAFSRVAEESYGELEEIVTG